MLHKLPILFILSILPVVAFAKSATVTTVLPDGTVSEKVYELAEVEPDVLRLHIPVEEIRADAKFLDIQPDFAKAEKGEEGYWIFPRGLYGTYRADTGSANCWPLMPMFGMKTPRDTFLAVTDGMIFEYKIYVEAQAGKYRMFHRYYIADIGFPPFEDITVDYHFLHDSEANYSGMGRCYRRLQLERGVVRSLKDRIASGASPDLEYLCDAIAIRVMHACKPYDQTEKIDYTPETELPVRALMTFDNARVMLDKLKAAGVDRAALCTAGWQYGGYDGRSPQTFPVEPCVGGEEKLREYIAYAHELGYQIDAHANFTDTYTVSALYTPDIVCRKPDGTLWTNYYWAGGNAYNLCPRNAWETFYSDDMRKTAALGFRGAHYIDVFSATRPYSCNHPDHPCNRSEAAEYQRKMLHFAKTLCGGAASECGWDHCIGELDYINYVARDLLSQSRGKLPTLADDIVPLWEIVYHGIVLSTPDKYLQNRLTPAQQLKLVEFGGRPIFYNTDINSIREAYEAFKPLRYLQKEFMDSHEILAPGVQKIRYSDGSIIYCNHTSDDYNLPDGSTVKAGSYMLIRE